MEALDIIKGKRTKRQRLQSPIPFSIPANSSSRDRYESNVTPTNSANFAKSVITEEEKYMANCLILLAQGRPYVCREKGFNLTSKRFNVYQCKTCERTFPSFQALGGHRASHKKPKPTTTSLLLNEEVQIEAPSERGPFYFNQTRSYTNKIHECSICGAKFMSGQALGGHMRRHKADPVGTNTNLSLSALSGFELDDHQEIKRKEILLSLDLDLNLPAPKNDHRKQQQNQKSPMVLSVAPTLVDCYY